MGTFSETSAIQQINSDQIFLNVWFFYNERGDGVSNAQTIDHLID